MPVPKDDKVTDGTKIKPHPYDPDDVPWSFYDVTPIINGTEPRPGLGTRDQCHEGWGGNEEEESMKCAIWNHHDKLTLLNQRMAAIEQYVKDEKTPVKERIAALEQKHTDEVDAIKQKHEGEVAEKEARIEELEHKLIRMGKMLAVVAKEFEQTTGHA